MKISRMHRRWRLDTETTTYFDDSTMGFLRSCKRAFFRWLAR